jgi:hypothetical protein
MFFPVSESITRHSSGFGGHPRNTSGHGHAPGASAGWLGNKGRRGVQSHSVHSSDAGLVLKGGRKHHAFEPSVAPYPLCYEPEVLELYVLGVQIDVMTTSTSVLAIS